MKRLFSILMTVLLLTALAACGNSVQTETKETQAAAGGKTESAKIENTAESERTPEDSSAAEESAQTVPDGSASAADDLNAHSDTLVVYFSATGTTKGVAEKIASITEADIYEITEAEPYSAEDLNYNDRNSRSTKEQNDKSARPKIGSKPLDLTGYKTVYLGFPIWWGEEPRIMDTFVESYSFEGITVIPFCTSASSGIGRSGPNMEALAGSGTWLEGKRFSSGATEADLQSWIEGLE